MEKEFVPYELAVKLKALGFDEPCFAFYQIEYAEVIPTMVDDNEQYKLTGFRTCKNSEIPEHYTSAPTFQQAFRWFREKYKLTSAVLPFQDIEDDVKLCYYYCVVDLIEAENEDILCNESSLGASDANFSSYEEAELACLEKLIEIINNTK